MTRRSLLPLYASGLVMAQRAGRDPLSLAPYYPTPRKVVRRMLELSELKKGERIFDLGSGDGRVVIMAAKDFGALATGVELDAKLVASSREEIRKQRLSNASIIEGDLLAQDYRQAQVVCVYLWPDSNERVRQKLEAELPPRARVVAHDFEIPGWNPHRTELIEDDGFGQSRTLFLYLR
jgi:SAM-dependent methyltransferase